MTGLNTRASMNKNLDKILPYPFERLAELLAGINPPQEKKTIRWTIGEPAHASPEFVKKVLIENIDSLSVYPMTKGSDELRAAIAAWLSKRFSLPASTIDPDKNILPVCGTREALFSFAQCAVNSGPDALVAMPNPFYQIYEGAAFMAGASPYFMNLEAGTRFIPDFDAVPPVVWQRCQLLYVCSPNNPAGTCLGADHWRKVIEVAHKYNFIIAADECYSEIYFGEPPIGLLQAAQTLGLTDLKNCIVFHSLSKRSNLPGLRSGFVAGDAQIIEKYRLYRTYHGSTMPPPSQKASTAAWLDEEHVVANRKLYTDKFAAVLKVLNEAGIAVEQPEGGFYLWLQVPQDDTTFARRLYQEENLLVLPGSYLSRENDGQNPGYKRVRIALVAGLEECVEGAQRLANFMKRL